MYFLGQAGNYRAGDILRHLFAVGTRKSSRNLKSHLAERYGVKRSQVLLYHTGRTALAAAIKTLVPEGSEVVATSLTCYAVYEAITGAKCQPVFADVDLNTLHYGGRELEKVLKTHNNVKAIIIQNNLGIPCDIASIEQVAKKHNLIIIEDLAHCAGVRYKDGREAGTVGAAAALSFGKGKSIDTICGGALVMRTDVKMPTAPRKLPKFADRFRDRFYPLFGAEIRGFYHFGIKAGRVFTSALIHLGFIKRSADESLNFNTRLTHWQARLALRQFMKLPESREPLRRFYFVDDRDKVLSKLAWRGFIMYDTWYDVPISPERYYKKVGLDEGTCPNAVYAAEHIVNLPNHYAFTELRDARNIIEKYQTNNQIAKEEK